MSETYDMLIINPAFLGDKKRASTEDNNAMEIDEPTMPLSESEADTQQMKDAEAARLTEEVNKDKAEAEKLFRDGKWELGATKYGAAIAKDATDPVLYANRAACSLVQSKWIDTVSDAAKAVCLDKYYARAWARLAKAYFA